MTIKWLRCSKCQMVDKTDKIHVGTSQAMHCPDCSTLSDPHATMCRHCCPTGHGTRWVEHPSLKEPKQ